MKCFACGKSNIINIIEVRNKASGKVKGICHRCYNQAKVCVEGLLHKGRILTINNREEIVEIKKEKGSELKLNIRGVTK